MFIKQVYEDCKWKNIFTLSVFWGSPVSLFEAPLEYYQAANCCCLRCNQNIIKYPTSADCFGMETLYVQNSVRQLWGNVHTYRTFQNKNLVSGRKYWVNPFMKLWTCVCVVHSCTRVMLMMRATQTMPGWRRGLSITMMTQEKSSNTLNSGWAISTKWRSFQIEMMVLCQLLIFV